MEDALSYMFGGGDAACWMILRDGGVMSAAAGVMMARDVSSDRTKNNACEVAIVVDTVDVSLPSWCVGTHTKNARQGSSVACCLYLKRV